MLLPQHCAAWVPHPEIKQASVRDAQCSCWSIPSRTHPSQVPEKATHTPESRRGGGPALQGLSRTGLEVASSLALALGMQWMGAVCGHMAGCAGGQSRDSSQGDSGSFGCLRSEGSARKIRAGPRAVSEPLKARHRGGPRLEEGIPSRAPALAWSVQGAAILLTDHRA
jgi:hypothetical protein